MQLYIKDFGAQADGQVDDTDAFERAIDLIRRHGGGRLVVSGGSFDDDDNILDPTIYRIRPINLTSHMELYLQRNVVIKGIANNNSWPIIPGAPSYGQGRDHVGPRHTSLIHGEHLVNVTVRGACTNTSVIDGNGVYWYKMRAAKQDVVTRGSLIEFMYSSQVQLYNIRLKDSPFWTVHFYDCEDVHVKDCQIRAPMDSPNTDGFDPDSSRNVLIEDSTYSGGGDCVAIKSGWDCFGLQYNKPTVNVTIRNLTCGFGGGIAIGSEMSGGVENVIAEHIHFPGSVNKPVNIKTSNSRGGYIRNATFRDFDVTGILQQPGIFIDTIRYSNNKGSKNPSCPANWTPSLLPVIEGLYFYRINGSTVDLQSNETYHIMAYPDSPIRNMVMQDVHFPSPPQAGAVATANRNHGEAWHCSSVQGFVVNHTVTPWPPCEGFRIVYERTATNSTMVGASGPFHSCGFEFVAVAVLVVVILTTLLVVRWSAHQKRIIIKF